MVRTRLPACGPGTVRRLLVAIVGLCAVTGIPVASAAECRALPADVPGQERFEFPRVIANLRLDERAISSDPAIGSTARYWMGGGSLAIRIASPAEASPADGNESPVFTERFDSLKKALQADPRFDRVALQSERSVSIGSGAVPAREALYQLRAGNQQAMQFSWLAAKYGRFIEVDLMLDPPRWNQAMEISQAVLQSLGAVLCRDFKVSHGLSAAHREIVSAVQRMQSAATLEEALPDLQRVTGFVQNEPAVVSIHFDDAFFQQSGNDSADGILMAYYVAGAARFDIENPTDRFDPLADVPASIRGMIAGYRLFTVENAWFVHPFVEQMMRREDAGELDHWVLRGAR